MTIESYRPTARFTIISNDCFNDHRLSCDALAFFTYLRSKPANWKVIQTELSKRFKIGRDRVRNAINELIKFGYIRKFPSRNPKTGLWSGVDYLVLALCGSPPERLTDDRQTAVAPSCAAEAAPAPDAPAPETPRPENRSLLSTDLLLSTDSTKKDTSRIAAGAANASDRNPMAYRQSPAEAAVAWNELKRMDWQTVFDEDEMTHWYALLRKGYAADDIVDVAVKFLCRIPDAPTLGDWLSWIFESYLEDEAEDAATPLSPTPRVPVIQHYA